jgi:hypothetical protein
MAVASGIGEGSGWGVDFSRFAALDKPLHLATIWQQRWPCQPNVSPTSPRMGLRRKAKFPKQFKRHRNVTPTPLMWQTTRT